MIKLLKTDSEGPSMSIPYLSLEQDGITVLWGYTTYLCTTLEDLKKHLGDILDQGAPATLFTSSAIDHPEELDLSPEVLAIVEAVQKW